MSFDAEDILEVFSRPKPESPSSDAIVSLRRIFVKCIERFKLIEGLELDRENYDQFAVFFTLIEALPNGKEQVESILGYLPRISGPTALVPSGLHAKVMESTMKHLDSRFSLQNEFNGLRSVFPIDAAVYVDDNLLAFIEIDGDFHYKFQQELRRKDRLKEFLYKSKFPSVPLYRVRYDHCEALGFTKLGRILAAWLSAQEKKRFKS